jgi:L-threonylcarbamoyladenylate synthase
MNLNEQITKASEIIRAGGIAAFPTETVYGIGANALDEKAVAKIFAIKGRPEKNPLIVHVSNLEQLDEVVEEISAEARTLIENFWPGPLTLIFRKKRIVPAIVTAGLDTVAVRMPAHPSTLEIIQKAGTPLAAPSANPSGKPSSTHHRHVMDYFGEQLFVVEGGECPIGVESTVLYIDSDPPKVLRQGGLEQEEIERVLGKKAAVFTEARQALSPGMLFKHYSPRAEVILVEYSIRMGEELRRSIQSELGKKKKVGALVTEEYLVYLPENVSVISLGTIFDLKTVAASLFSGLIEMDSRGSEVIVVQSFPEEGLGKAVMDRLRRASKR